MICFLKLHHSKTGLILETIMNRAIFSNYELTARYNFNDKTYMWKVQLRITYAVKEKAQ